MNVSLPRTTALCLALALAACSTASIRRRDGSTVRAEIKGSNAKAVCVALEGIAGARPGTRMHVEFMKRQLERDGSERCPIDQVAIARKDIRDIDHPGDIPALIFTPLAVAGWIPSLMSIASYPDDKGEAFRTYGIFMTAFAVTSTIAAVWGWISWGTSRSAAAPPAEFSIRW
jgi:hypothetical protein